MLVRIFSDDVQRLREVRAAVAPGFNAVTFGLEPVATAQAGGTAVFAVNLGAPDTVANLKRVLPCVGRLRSRIFLLPDANRHAMVQAYALGATAVVSRREDLLRLLALLRDQEKRPAADDHVRVAEEGVAALSEMFLSAVAGNSIDVSAPVRSADAIAQAVRQDGLGRWIDAVRRHHESTYQHCLLVTGLAADFAQFLGMRASDVQRLTTAAVFHDIGKAFIPLAILDKPGKLDTHERSAIESHPFLGYEALQQSGSMSEEVLDAVLHHHEWLDGTGYSDRLKGDEIGDIVRMLTICDIFAALIEDRGYRPAMPRADAYGLLRGMVGKIEKAMFEVFEEVALVR